MNKLRQRMSKAKRDKLERVYRLMDSFRDTSKNMCEDDLTPQETKIIRHAITEARNTT